ncbi:MAG: glycosyltransferase family 39 protein [Bdellovibrionaceae bacterium]|nr:glycosyltransferase family 39 protein [Pseudobdellovibrionaceae bacterium]
MRTLKISLISLAALAWATLITYFFLRYPWPWPDESLYADIARHFRNTGEMGIPMFKGYFTEIESHQHFYPPLYFMTLGALFFIFPYSLITLRFFSLFCLLSATVWSFARLSKKTLGPMAVSGGVLVLMTDPVFIRGLLVGRMDSLGVFLTLGSLLLLHSGECHPHRAKRRYFLFGSGLIGGLAFLTHPMAWAAPATLGLYTLVQLIRKKLKPIEVGLIALGGIGISLPYLVWLYGEWGFFAEQFSAQMARKHLVSPKGIREALKSFEGLFAQYEAVKAIGMLSYILGFVGLVIYTWKDQRGLKFLIVHLLFTYLATFSREMWYPVYWMVTSAIGVAILLHTANRRVAWTLASLVVVGHLYGVFVKARQLRPYNYQTYCEVLKQKIPPGAKVFLTSVPDAYFCLDESFREGIRQFIPGGIPVPKDSAVAIFDTHDVFIAGSFFVGEHLEEYIKGSKDHFEIDSGVAGGFPYTLYLRKTAPANSLRDQ